MRKENNNLEYKPLLILFFHFWLFLYTCGNYRINKAHARPPAPANVSHTESFGLSKWKPKGRGVSMPEDTHTHTHA